MIKPLTSLRFIFALMVFTSHFCLIDISDKTLSGFYNTLFPEGFMGVSFFFILSGFILALNYQERLLSGQTTAGEFYIARVARIYPLHLFTLICSMPLLYSIFVSQPVSFFARLTLNTFLLQSFIPIRDFYFSFNIPSWSISCEMFFYLMFPLIIALLFRFKNAYKFILVILVLLPVGILFCPDSIEHGMFYVNPFFRITDFMIGILLYNVYEKHWLRGLFKTRLLSTVMELASLGIMVLFMAYHKDVPEGYRYSCYYWIPMIVIIFVFSYQSGLVSTLLSNKVMVLLGEISYSFYLLHYLVIRYATALARKFQFAINDYIFILIILAIVLLGSYFTHKLIEQPANKMIKLKAMRVFVDNRGKEI